jgi:RNA polymerase sigma factor (sigma-70 family)
VTSETFDDVAAQALPGMLRYAAALTGDREQAQDLVQDVLARAFQHWTRVQRSDNAQAYLTRMLTNEFLSWRRRVSRRVATVPGDLPNSAASGDFVVDMVARADLRSRLAALPRRQSVAIVLRYYLGFPDSESASMLNCTESTVRSLCSRALSALRLNAETAAPPAAPTPRSHLTQRPCRDSSAL